jgi:hypothetical protein
MTIVGRFGGTNMSEEKLHCSSVTQAFISFMGRYA